MKSLANGDGPGVVHALGASSPGTPYGLTLTGVTLNQLPEIWAGATSRGSL
jgi:hypothetical protein